MTSSGAPGAKLVADAVHEFLKEAKSEKGRNLRQPTYVKYQGLLGRLPEEGPSRSKTPSYTLKQYCADRNILTLDQISADCSAGFDSFPGKSGHSPSEAASAAVT